MARRAIVTGASSGIGRATALELGRRGYDVGVTFQRDEAGAGATVGELERYGVRGFSVQLDLRAPESADAVIGRLADSLGGVDAFVNNAGANRRATVLEETVAGFSAALAVNLVGAWAAARAAAARMIADGTHGRIVNVTSILATQPLRGGGAYGAAKAGLEALTRVMALELAEHGIRVNAVAPGHTATPMNFPPEVLAAGPPARPVIPLGRAADTGELAEVIAFLVGEGGYVTGTSLLVDGGLALASGPEALEAAIGLPPERT
jgi:NAD(P)-dependent dehydrogenase (short-subunit alcohol dehydrogenase family)